MDLKITVAKSVEFGTAVSAECGPLHALTYGLSARCNRCNRDCGGASRTTRSLQCSVVHSFCHITPSGEIDVRFGSALQFFRLHWLKICRLLILLCEIMALADRNAHFPRGSSSSVTRRADSIAFGRHLVGSMGCFLPKPQQVSIAACRPHWLQRPRGIRKNYFSGDAETAASKPAAGTITTNQTSLCSAECSLLPLAKS